MIANVRRYLYCRQKPFYFNLMHLEMTLSCYVRGRESRTSSPFSSGYLAIFEMRIARKICIDSQLDVTLVYN
jgi:hypothetical protein